MNKIEKLETLLRNQIRWFKDCELDKERYDDSYTYDMAGEQFGRFELFEILNILTKEN